MQIINIEAATQAVTGRAESFFTADIALNKPQLQAEISNASILVIGGAGTIGSNFVKALLTIAKPAKLIIVDINENGLTEVVRDLRSAIGYHIPDDMRTYPINFSDAVFEKMYKAEQPFDVVANFAAHKHVRSEKDHFSIEAMIDNNVIKAKRLLDVLQEQPPKHFFCVSTDKAANPVNIMGASKKLMEDVIMTYASTMKITTARFANVAFSNGSLPAGFIERLMKRQPFSCPADVTRFFVSPIESGQICMMACLLGKSGDIFFPKLDPVTDLKPFTIIAKSLINQLGMQPQECQSEQEAKELATQLSPSSTHYPVYFFNSDTSGEKSFEEFYTENETLDIVSFSSLGIVKNTPKKAIQEIEDLISQLKTAFTQTDLDKSTIVSILSHYIPNFEHIETGKSLDQKM